MSDTNAAGAAGSGLPDKRLAQLKHDVAQQRRLPDLAALLSAAASQTRLRLLYLLWREGEVRVNDLALLLDVTTPAVSQQLKKLRQQHLVRTRRAAQTVYYRLNADSDLTHLLSWYFEHGALPESSRYASADGAAHEA